MEISCSASGPGRGAAPPFGDAEVMSATTSDQAGVCQVSGAQALRRFNSGRGNHRVGAVPANNRQDRGHRSTPGFGSWDSPATRVLRVMRALPVTAGVGAAKTHDGRVITQAPNVMWGTDGVPPMQARRRVGLDLRGSRTQGTRSVWGGIKVGSRFAALDPIAQRVGQLG